MKNVDHFAGAGKVMRQLTILPALTKWSNSARKCPVALECYGDGAIQRIGGTMPEDIPPVEHIKQVEKRLKSMPAKLKLEDKDAKGLAGGQETN
ncbi:hypothetical protein L0337_21230 [candidate division KSB1 bacterium]|nr:hypothetical protein [candidate division KSB1 bacterium]